MSARARIGTSGYSYKHWKGVFYPDDVPQRRWLEYFAERFDTVELNNPFYSMPTEDKCDGWRERAPQGFVYAVKMNRVITHRKYLKDSDRTIGDYLDAVDRLGERLGPVLVQLPPNWHADLARLDDFLDRVPTGYRWAVEFRDPDWLAEPTFDILRKHNAALVVHDLIDNHPAPPTADWTYRRYHGAAGKYQGQYTPQKLRAEADRILEDLEAGRDVYAYFNNDVGGYAVRDALKLRDFVSG